MRHKAPALSSAKLDYLRKHAAGMTVDEVVRYTGHAVTTVRPMLSRMGLKCKDQKRYGLSELVQRMVDAGYLLEDESTLLAPEGLVRDYAKEQYMRERYGVVFVRAKSEMTGRRDVMGMRCRMRGHGYEVPVGGYVAYYSSATLRVKRMEERARELGFRIMMAPKQYTGNRVEALLQAEAERKCRKNRPKPATAKEKDVPAWREDNSAMEALKGKVDTMRALLLQTDLTDPLWSDLCGRIRAAELRLRSMEDQNDRKAEKYDINYSIQL